MKITLLYLRIIRRVEPTLPMCVPYETAEKRWLETYKKFKPTIPHTLTIVNCGDDRRDPEWDEVANSYVSYNGFGSDTGTFKAVGSGLDCDLAIGFNTVSYFWRSGWLEPFVLAYEMNGPGVYGPTASYEQNPHLRTPCIGFNPSVIRDYPYVTDTREKAGFFEHGHDNFSLWAHRLRLPSLLITETAYYNKEAWRLAPNIFRRGDQSNCLVWDRHTDIYAKATPQEKQVLAASADGVRIK